MSFYEHGNNYPGIFDYGYTDKQTDRANLYEEIIQPPENLQHEKILNEQETETLQRLQGAAHQNLLRQNLDQALDGFQKCLKFYYQAVGEAWTNSHYRAYFREILVFLNDHALKFLKEENIREAMKILSRLNKFTDGTELGFFPAMRNLTFNHIACCYRRMGKFDEALKYLYRALDFGVSSERMDTIGITHINLCAILSQMNNHRKALEHAKKAIYECSFDIVRQDRKLENKETNAKKATTLAIAYHNLGVEEEFCGNLEAAKLAYFKAFEMLERINGPNDQLVEKFKQTYLEAKEIIRGFPSKGIPMQSSTGNLTGRPMSATFRLHLPKRSYDDNAHGYTARTSSRVSLLQQSSIRRTDREPATRYKSQQVHAESITKSSSRIFTQNFDSPKEMSRPRTANPYYPQNFSRQDYAISPRPNDEKPPVKTLEDEMWELEQFVGTEETKTSKELRAIIKNNQAILYKNALKYHEKSCLQSPREYNSNTQTESALYTISSAIQLHTDRQPATTRITMRMYKAAVVIQRFIRGFLARKRVRRSKSHMQFLFHLVDKFALDLEKPLEMHHYQVFCWFDLQLERIIFNVTSLDNEKQRYSTKINYLLPRGTPKNDALGEAKEFALAKLPLMYVTNGDLLFRSKEEGGSKKEVPESNTQNSFAEDEVDFFISDNEIRQSRKRSSQISSKRKISSTTQIEKTAKGDATPGFDESKIPLLVKTQKWIRGHLSRKRHLVLRKKNYQVIFSQCFRQENHTLRVRILERVHKIQKEKPPKVVIVAHDLTDKAAFNVLTYGHGDLKTVEPFEINLPEIREVIQFDVKMHYMDYKNKISSDSYTSDDDSSESADSLREREDLEPKDPENEIEADSNQEEASNQEGEEGDDEYDQSPGERYYEDELFDNSIEETEFLTTVPLLFEDDIEFTASVYYDKQKKELCVEARSAEFETQVLRVSLKEMGLVTFNKQNFIKNLEKMLLAHLAIEDGKIIFESDKTLPPCFEVVEEEPTSRNRSLLKTDQSSATGRELPMVRSMSKELSGKKKKSWVNISPRGGVEISQSLKSLNQKAESDAKGSEGEKRNSNAGSEKTNKDKSEVKEESKNEPIMRATKLKFEEDADLLPNKERENGPQSYPQMMKTSELANLMAIRSGPSRLKKVSEKMRGDIEISKEKSDKKQQEKSEVENILKELSASEHDAEEEREIPIIDDGKRANGQQNEIQLIVNAMVDRAEDPMQSRRNSKKSPMNYLEVEKPLGSRSNVGSQQALVDFVDPEAEEVISPILKSGPMNRETACFSQNLIEEGETQKSKSPDDEEKEPQKEAEEEGKRPEEEYQLVIHEEEPKPLNSDEEDALIYLESEASRAWSQRPSLISPRHSNMRKIEEEKRESYFKADQPIYIEKGHDHLSVKDTLSPQSNHANSRPRSLVF